MSGNRIKILSTSGKFGKWGFPGNFRIFLVTCWKHPARNFFFSATTPLFYFFILKPIIRASFWDLPRFGTPKNGGATNFRSWNFVFSARAAAEKFEFRRFFSDDPRFLFFYFVLLLRRFRLRYSWVRYLKIWGSYKFLKQKNTSSPVSRDRKKNP